MPRSVEEIEQQLEAAREQLELEKNSMSDKVYEDANEAIVELEKELRRAQLARLEGATGGAVIVAPQNCKVMVGFNMDSAGKEAKELTKFLNDHGFPTFSTCVYCPSTPGSDWKTSTNLGISNAKVLVTLITKGWMKSKECAKETNTFQMLMNNDKEKTIIPVNFPGITQTDYADPLSCLFNMMTVQQIDGTQPNWMEDVLQGVRNSIR